MKTLKTVKCGHGKLHTNSDDELSSFDPQKPVFLTIHGLFADHGIWNTWDHLLNQDGHWVYHLELPGRNAERQHTRGDLGLVDATHAFEEAIRFLNKQHTHIVLICHSAGCAVAMNSHSVRFWPTVKQIFFLNPSPIQLWDLPLSNITTCLKYAGAIAKGEVVEPTKKDLARFLLPGYASVPGEELPTLNESGGFMGDVILGLRPERWPNTPTVILGGKKDNMTPIGVAQKVAKHLSQVCVNPSGGPAQPKVTRDTFIECGHLPMVGVGAEERLRVILGLLDL